jgi:hypothetical protein
MTVFILSLKLHRGGLVFILKSLILNFIGRIVHPVMTGWQNWSLSVVGDFFAEERN